MLNLNNIIIIIIISQEIIAKKFAISAKTQLAHFGEHAQIIKWSFRQFKAEILEDIFSDFLLFIFNFNSVKLFLNIFEYFLYKHLQ